MYFHATRASRFIEMGRKKQLGTERSRSGNGANLGFEEKLWAAADKMRGHMDAGEYKHVALGLIFLKYISDAFQERYDEIKKEPNARSRGAGRVHERERLLGASRGPLGEAPGRCQVARDRQGHRQRDGRDREGEPDAQESIAQGLRPPCPRQDPPGRADRP